MILNLTVSLSIRMSLVTEESTSFIRARSKMQGSSTSDTTVSLQAVSTRNCAVTSNIAGLEGPHIKLICALPASVSVTMVSMRPRYCTTIESSPLRKSYVYAALFHSTSTTPIRTILSPNATHGPTLRSILRSQSLIRPASTVVLISPLFKK